MIIEERRSRTENNPSASSREQMSAALYQNHPYRHSRSSAGCTRWRSCRARTRSLLQALLCAQQRHRRRRRRRHGRRGEARWPRRPTAAQANPDINDARSARRSRRSIAARRLELKDPRAGNASVRRFYLAPSYPDGKPRRGRGALPADEDRSPTAAPAASIRSWCRTRRSRPAPAAGTRAPVSIAARIGALCGGRARASTSTRSRLAVDRVLHELRENGVTPDELERAKKALHRRLHLRVATARARSRGAMAEGMLLGQTIDQVNDWPAAIAKVTAEDIKQVGRQAISTSATRSPAGCSRRRLKRRERRVGREAGRRQTVRSTVMTLRAVDRCRAPAAARRLACRRPGSLTLSFPSQQGATP